MEADFKKILLPVDLSDVSPKMVPFVKSVARKWDAQIHLLFAVRVLEHYTAMYVPDVSIAKLEQEMIQGAERKLEEFAQEHFGQFKDVSASVVSGDAAEQIIKFVNDNDIDLIVMGTHGRKGLERVLFGSVAERVLKTSPVPVLSVNPYRKREHK
jgi:nucleotide-binding universal stress UspA family protein